MKTHCPLPPDLLWFPVLLVLATGRAPAADAPRPAAGLLPEGAEVVQLEVFPREIVLGDRYATRQLLVTAVLSGGERIDATRGVEASGALELVSVSELGQVRALQDGTGELTIAFAGKMAPVPVRVSGTADPYEVSFVQDVMPILSRLGCSSGTCHGSQKGQNGFKLSLRGNDPAFDHRALIDDLEGRRFNRAAPDRSLFLMKVSGGVPHVGGVLTRSGEPYYEKLRSWVAAGVPLDLESPRVERIEVFPEEPVLPLPGTEQQMAVVATFSDGSMRDVTGESFIETSSTEVTSVSPRGVVTALRRGEAAIMARYEGRYAATQLYVMGDRSGFEWQEVPEYNVIDTLVYEKLRKVKTLPSPVASDAEFLRRIYLDLTGLSPSPRDIRVFLMDRRDSRAKREEVAGRLIGSAEFVEYWTNKWSDLLQVNRKWLGAEGAEVLRQWIRAAVASNMPYDEFARIILNSSGSNIENPPASYYKVLREPEEAMENTTQLFLGVRFNCNKCHDHPFERWTQKNYWELAAYFARVGRKPAPGAKELPDAGFADTGATEEVIFDKDDGELKLPSGAPAAPAFPYTHPGSVPEEGTRRDVLAAWLTAPENPYFARSFVNRIWSYFLGVGLIDPVDDIRAGNPPTNPELLDRLTADFIASGFDVRALMRRIVTSRTYQHSIETNRWNEDDTINFSHAYARRLPAETLYDVIHRATGSLARLPGQRLGTRAAELPDPQVKLADGFLDLFGRPPRESACECERTSGMSLGQALNLVNGPTIADAIHDPNNRIADLVRVEKDPGPIVEELFLAFLCRMPLGEERATFAKALDPREPENVDALGPAGRKELDERFARWKDSQKIPAWSHLEPLLARSAAGVALAVQEDGSVLAGGATPETDSYVVAAWTDLERITGVRLEVLPDEALPGKGPGRADNGNFVLSELRLSVLPSGGAAKGADAALENATQSFTQKDFSAALVIDGKSDDKKGWAIAERAGQRHRAVFEVRDGIESPGGMLLVFTLDQHFGGKHTLGRFRISVTSSEKPVRVLSVPEDIAARLLTPPEKRSAEDETALLRYYLSTDAEMRDRIRLSAAQDIAWALANSPAFLFNR